MAFNLQKHSSVKTYQRSYSNLRGVDFSSLPSKVQPNRSPDALNVYKDYSSDLGQAIETRKGITLLGSVTGATTNEIYGIHIFSSSKALIHCETKLYIWSNFPSTPMTTSDSTVTMAKAYSTSFMFDGSLYILDGTNYYVYNGTSVTAVVGYVPTTSITAEYDGTNRVSYQAVNYISDYRKNEFLGDGSHAVFTLDVTSYDNEEPTVTVSGSSATVASFDYAHGTVTLSSAPADNAPVIIQFKKATSGYADHIKKCTLAKVFDNRVFVSGNGSYKGVLFHSELNDPTYFSDENWYDDGKDGVAITALLKSGNRLIVVKDSVGEGVKVFYHTATYDSTYGAVYPKSETEISTGGFTGINFIDGTLFLSKLGLEYIYLNGESGTRLYHRSTLVDTKLVNESNYTSAKMEVWRNYLCVLVDGKIYLADSKQMSNYEYEWYYWDNIGVNSVDLATLYKATVLKEYDNELYFGTDAGHICYFTGTADTDIAGTDVLIESYWITPPDVFNSLAYVKTTHKKGGVAQVKRIPNSILKIDVATDLETWSNIKSSSTTGFSYISFNYTSFSYGTGVRGYVPFNAKKKKVMELALKFYSDIVNKPFGIYEITTEYEYSNYYK